MILNDTSKTNACTNWFLSPSAATNLELMAALIGGSQQSLSRKRFRARYAQIVHIHQADVLNTDCGIMGINSNVQNFASNRHGSQSLHLDVSPCLLGDFGGKTPNLFQFYGHLYRMGNMMIYREIFGCFESRHLRLPWMMSPTSLNVLAVGRLGFKAVGGYRL